jgi:uridine kinase
MEDMKMMGPDEQPAYALAVEPLSSLLYNLPAKLIAIDGREGCGKTTFGRYLAWRFNSSLIETDLFLIDGMDQLVHRQDEIKRIVEKRLGKPLPVFIEGVAILRLIEAIGRRPDFVIYVSNTNYSESRTLAEELAQYDVVFRPRERADVIIELNV